jgi:hypothetical protein
VIAISDAEKSAERQNRVGNLAGLLVDHEVMDRAQTIASVVEDVGALDFVGSDKGRCLADGVHKEFSLAVVRGENVNASRNVPVGGAPFEKRARRGHRF